MADQTTPVDRLDVSWLLPSATDAALPNQSITMSGGRVVAVEPARRPPADGGLALPALVNAHDHARVVRLSQVGSFDVPLEAWLPYLAVIPAVDPWLASAVAFGRTARGGVGSVMAHYTRVQGLTDFPTEARAVAKAARDIGINVAFAVHCRDLNPIVYGPHDELLAQLSPDARACMTRRFLKPPRPAAEQVAMVESVAADVEGGNVTVQYGPAGVQWCSDEMLRRIGEASARTGRRVHMHLLETKYQRAWADHTFPHGIVGYLDEIGLVNERVSFAHCIWMRPDEMDLVAQRGATIVSNTSSNLIVSSGIAPVAEMLGRGCRIAMGLDGLALDEDEDALREMRLGYILHKASGFDIRMSHADLLRFGFEHGRFAITGEAHGGRIAPGAPADILVLDWEELAAELVELEVAPLELLLARARQQHVKACSSAAAKSCATAPSPASICRRSRTRCWRSFVQHIPTPPTSAPPCPSSRLRRARIIARRSTAPESGSACPERRDDATAERPGLQRHRCPSGRAGALPGGARKGAVGQSARRLCPARPPRGRAARSARVLGRIPFGAGRCRGEQRHGQRNEPDHPQPLWLRRGPGHRLERARRCSAARTRLDRGPLRRRKFATAGCTAAVLRYRNGTSPPTHSRCGRSNAAAWRATAPSSCISPTTRRSAGWSDRVGCSNASSPARTM